MKSILKHRVNFLIVLTVLIIAKVVAQDSTQNNSAVYGLKLEKLLELNTNTVSGLDENRIEAPSSMVVITEEDIKNRGYNSLAEVMMDLPGFDNSVANGTVYMNSYQRGYRTPFTQRTLIMIDGVVDNNLWSHAAIISRQYPITAIKRIEVLYGPVSAVYGPNAFLGIINIVTKNADAYIKNVSNTEVKAEYGSFNSKGIDATTIGKSGAVNYMVSGRVFRSDEPDFSEEYGFLNNKLYNDSTIWGPIRDQSFNNKNLNEYNDYTDNYSFLGNINYNGFKLGIINWTTKEGYGPYYAADRAQNNTTWNHSSSQVYAQHDKSLSVRLDMQTLMLYRTTRIWGKWAEAAPDPSDPNYSYISLTSWSNYNSSMLFKQNVTYNAFNWLSFVAGVKYERKYLTKAYDIPGYYNAYSSAGNANDPGPYGYGFGVGHSTDSAYNLPPEASKFMSQNNMVTTDDIGGFIQGIIDLEKWRFHLGIRHDNNSIYGNSTNPRVSAIYKLDDGKGAIKLIYGEAFQEPSPLQLFGGWSGRLENPDLKPEKAKNLELNGLYKIGPILFDATGYYAQYDNVIKEEAENAGHRNIMGSEVKTYIDIPNFIKKSKTITGYLFYSYTKATSSISYNHTSGAWEEKTSDLGDIAPHKLNAGFNLPIKSKFTLNTRFNYVSDRLVYSRNALRVDNYKIAAYYTLDAAISYQLKPLTFSAKINNLLNAKYFHPGLEQANAGTDFSQRSKGFQNSLLPQAGRNFSVSVRLNF